MRDALRVSGGKTKRAVVEAALRLLVQTKAQAGIRRLLGRLIGTATSLKQGNAIAIFLKRWPDDVARVLFLEEV